MWYTFVIETEECIQGRFMQTVVKESENRYDAMDAIVKEARESGVGIEVINLVTISESKPYACNTELQSFITEQK